MKLIGLSLSFCIKHILSGFVDINDVDYIQTNCQFDSKATLLEPGGTVDRYMETYWAEFERDDVEDIIAKLDLRSRDQRTGIDHLPLDPEMYVSHNTHLGSWMTKITGWEKYGSSTVLPMGGYYDPRIKEHKTVTPRLNIEEGVYSRIYSVCTLKSAIA